MVEYRTFYPCCPGIRPLLRGFVLIPIYVISAYLYATSAQTQMLYVLMYWCMNVQLLVALTYHLFYFGAYDHIVRKLDHIAVVGVNAVLMAILGEKMSSDQVMIIAGLMPIVCAFVPNSIVVISIVQVAAGLCGARTLTCGGEWWFNHALACAATGFIYVLELCTKFPIQNKWIGWQDMFHILCGALYISRLTGMPDIY